MTLTHLFVYGTLRPGDVRWHFLEPYVVDEGRDDSVPGAVYDTGHGYPAAVFDEHAIGRIVGRTYALLESSLVAGLEVLDEEEGTVGGLYRRIAVTTTSGIRAWAYAYGTGLELRLIESGDWLQRTLGIPEPNLLSEPSQLH